MRYLTILALLSFALASCVKRGKVSDTPKLEYKNFISPSNIADTAFLILSYEDGDGDLFVDNFSQGKTLILTTYTYNTSAAKWEAKFDLELNDTARYATTLKQPDNGYYKGKSIKGDIIVPLLEYRPSKNAKTVKYTAFAIDSKKHVSNIVSSPSFTFGF